MALDKPIDAVTTEDVHALVTNGVAEGRQLEYKQLLPSGKDESKRELLKDVSAFANTVGGDLLFGVVEARDPDGNPTGIPESVPGLDVNVDAEKLRLESIIRDGLQPRVPGIEIRGIDGFDKGSILLVRVPRSLASPHQVSFKNFSRFFGRTSAGTYQLDVQEIRSAFTASEGFSQRVRDFLIARITAVKSGETPAPIASGPKLILHIVPLSAVGHGSAIDLATIERDRTKVRPMCVSGWDSRMNLDGLLVLDGDRPCFSYAQLYRTGVIEFVEAQMFRGPNGEIDGLVPHELFEMSVVKTVKHHLGVLAEVGISPPVSVHLSFTDVMGFSMSPASRMRSPSRFTIDRDDLLFPEVLADSMCPDVPRLLRPVFDAAWQASGFNRSANYSDDGQWKLSVS